MNNKPIQTKNDYKAAMARISELTSGDPYALSDIEFLVSNSSCGYRIKVLPLVIIYNTITN